MRKYQIIWAKLKRMPREDASKIGVSVVANRLLHARIIKAVIKEKWLDLGYKIQSEPNQMILSHTVEHSKITFYLNVQLSSIGKSKDSI